MKFGEIALKEELLKEEELQEALKLQKEHEKEHEKDKWPIGELLSFLGYLKDEHIETILNIQEKTKEHKINETKERRTSLMSFDGESFGHYKILNLLDRGGMGEVYRALDTHLEREVALKLVKGSNITENQIKRFLQEVRATAKLKHRNIVTLYEVGETPQNYFTMEYIKGSTLSTIIEKGELTPRDSAKIIEICARALYFAHKNGIIHRDIKPSNIMIDDTGEPKIMDFGLAKIQDDEQHLSKTGDLLGTIAYMSPEQATNTTLSAKTDIYSLGATLYHVLTGRPPFKGKNNINIIYQICHKEPVEPRNLNPDIHKDLEAICLKCLEKNPNKRYHKALVLAKDLDNYLNNRPTIAKPPSIFTYAWKFAVRNPVVIVTFLILVITGSFSFFQWQRAEKQRLSAEKERDKAQQNLGRIFLAKAKFAEKQKKFFEAKIYATKAIHSQFLKKNSKDWIEAKKIILGVPNFNLLWETPSFSSDSKPKICFNKKETLLAIAFDKKVKIWDIKKNKELALFRGHSKVTHLLFSLDSKTLVTVFDDKTIKLWDIKKKLEKTSFYQTSNICFSLDRNFFAFFDKAVKIWSLRNNKELVSLNAKAVTNLFFSPNNSILAIVSDEIIKLWDIKKNKEIATFDIHPKIINLQFTLNSNNLIATDDKTIKLWDIKRGNTFSLQGHSEKITNIRFSPNGNFLVSTSWLEKAKLWDIEQKKEIINIDNTTGLNFSSNNAFLASISSSEIISLWDIAKREKITTFDGSSKKRREHLKSLWAKAREKFRTITPNVSFSPDNKLLISITSDGNMKLWDIKKKRAELAAPKFAKFFPQVENAKFVLDGNALAFIVFHFGKPIEIGLWNIKEKRKDIIVFGLKNAGIDIKVNSSEKLSFSPNGNFLISVSHQIIKLWNIKKRKKKTISLGRNAKINSVCFSPDGTLLASASEDCTIKIWDIKTKRVIYNLIGHSKSVKYISFSPDGTLLASTSEDYTIKIWDIKTKQVICTFASHSEVVSFSPDGTILAFLSREALWGISYKVALWDIKNKQEVFSFNIPGIDISSCTFSPGGTILASASKGITLLDIKNKKIITSFGSSPTSFGNSIAKLRFSPDETILVSVMYNNTIKTWHKEKNGLFWDKKKLTWRETATLTGHTKTINSVCFSPNGYLLASASDKTIKIWNVGEKKEIATLTGHTKTINSVCFSPDGTILASASDDKTIKFWNIGEIPITRLENGIRPNNHLAASIYSRQLWDIIEKRKLALPPFEYYQRNFSLDGTLFAGYHPKKNFIKLWSFKEKKEIITFSDVKEEVNSMIFSPDNTFFALTSPNALKLWNIKKKKKVATIPLLSKVKNIFSSDSTFLIFALSQNLKARKKTSVIKFWDIRKKKEVFKFSVPFFVENMILSPDGTLLVLTSLEKSIIWNVKAKKKITVLNLGKNANFSPGGNLLALTSSKKSIIWNTKLKKEIATLDFGGNVSFNANETLLAVISQNKILKIWNIKQKKVTAYFTSKHDLEAYFAPNNSFLALAFHPPIVSFVKLWDVRSLLQKIPYSQYLKLFTFDRSLNIVFRNNSNTPRFTNFIYVPAYSYLALLQNDNISQHKKTRLLCKKYLLAGNLDSALLLFKQLKIKSKKDPLYKRLVQSLSQAIANAKDFKVYGLANRRQRQLTNIK